MRSLARPEQATHRAARRQWSPSERTDPPSASPTIWASTRFSPLPTLASEWQPAAGKRSGAPLGASDLHFCGTPNGIRTHPCRHLERVPEGGDSEPQRTETGGILGFSERCGRQRSRRIRAAAGYSRDGTIFPDVLQLEASRPPRYRDSTRIVDTFTRRRFGSTRNPMTLGQMIFRHAQPAKPRIWAQMNV